MASSSSSAPTPTLVCKECEYANEPERVYCHNCGAKLDRSVLPKDEQVRRESPDRARKRIMRMANPGSSVVLREIKALVKTLLLALGAAAIIQAMRPPPALPSATSDATSRIISSDLNDLVQSPTARVGVFSQDELNNYLKVKVVSKATLPGVAYKRSFVVLENGTARFVTEKAIYGYSLFLSTMYRVEGSNGTLIKANTGGSIGHLAIHPVLMQRLSPLIFGSIYEALKREWSLLEQMQSVVLHKGRLDVVSQGKK